MDKPVWQVVDCKECVNAFCEFRKHLHEIKDTQCACSEFTRKRTRILNPLIEEFVRQTNERFKQC